MSTWGTGLYQNDIGIEVRDDYKNKLRAGKCEYDAYNEIIQEYKNEMVDEDDIYNVWFALADTMWNLGRLNEEIKNIVLNLIPSENVEKRWNSQKDILRRRYVLEELEKKLMLEMGEKKHISVHKPYVTAWRPGDIYTIPINSSCECMKDYEGWYIVIYVYEVSKFEFVVPGVYDVCPIIYIMLSPSDLQSVEEILSLKYCCSVNNLKTNKKRYKYVLGEVSDRKIPRQIKFIGNTDNVKFPIDEEISNQTSSIILWNEFVDDAISGYKLAQKE
ncbi:MAG: hypothetical protein ACI4GW_09680 [Lachnospiraceae bacterium]